MKKYIKAAEQSWSHEAEVFGDLYEHGDYSMESVYDEIEKIFDKYGNEDDLATTLYDRASDQDKLLLMELAKRANNKVSSREDLSAKYHEMLGHYNSRSEPVYADGYVDAVQDMMEVFNIPEI